MSLEGAFSRGWTEFELVEVAGDVSGFWILCFLLCRTFTGGRSWRVCGRHVSERFHRPRGFSGICSILIRGNTLSYPNIVFGNDSILLIHFFAALRNFLIACLPRSAADTAPWASWEAELR